jgi:hypothetical protein
MAPETRSTTGRRLRQVGGLWKPKPGGTSLGSGSITVNGWKQRFVVLRHDRKDPGSQQPDYLLMSSDEPEVDDYEQRRERARDQPERADANDRRDDAHPVKSPL